MIGNGRDRGAATSFTIPPSTFEHHGFLWGSTKTLRWGTNVVDGVGIDIQLGNTTSRRLRTRFDRFTGDDECQAADGTRAGAAFIDDGGSWELAGVMIAIAAFNGQPAEVAAYDNASYMVDLSHYRSQILDVVTPLCGNGILTADEDCDDGNTLDGDCCSSSCQFEAAGSACEDGLFCTGADACDGAGVCTAGGADPCDDGLACTTHTCDEIALCQLVVDPSPAPKCAPRCRRAGPRGG